MSLFLVRSSKKRLKPLVLVVPSPTREMKKRLLLLLLLLRYTIEGGGDAAQKGHSLGLGRGRQRP